MTEDWLRLPGGDARVLASGDLDGCSVMELTTAPNEGPPLHIHSREDEGFVVVDGRYRFRVDDRDIDAQTGSFVLGPRGRSHTYRAGPTGGRLIVVLAPGGLERFFEEWAAAVADGSVNDGFLEELNRRHGMSLA